MIAHGIEVWPGAPNRLARFLAGQLKHCIAVSEVIRERLSAWAGIDAAKISVLHNCADLGRFTPGPKEPGMRARLGLEGKRLFMTLWRLETGERFKGFDEIHDVIPGMVAMYSAIVYMAAGDDNDRDQLEQKAHSLGIDGNVVFAGYVPEAKIVAYYRMVDAYVVPSRGEGFGIVFLGALGCGIPVVGDRVDGGLEVFLDSKLGRMVDPDDREELKSAILHALDQPKGSVVTDLLRYSEAAYRDRIHAIVHSIVGTER